MNKIRFIIRIYTHDGAYCSFKHWELAEKDFDRCGVPQLDENGRRIKWINDGDNYEVWTNIEN